MSVAVKGGFNAAAVISPLRADPAVCNPNESPLDCELRLWRPSGGHRQHGDVVVAEARAGV
ncbi:MAG: hypothetical protein M0C28_34705 [Candidatus Moduliflexus flocculans]|nr:hypothetical protein [Candidatus Moduliflexus flocculans]